MSNLGNFVPMAGPVREIFEILESLVDTECNHEHKAACEKANFECHELGIDGLEEAAVAIAERWGLS